MAALHETGVGLSESLITSVHVAPPLSAASSSAAASAPQTKRSRKDSAPLLAGPIAKWITRADAFEKVAGGPALIHIADHTSPD